jgi:hypothetical protein
MQSLLAPIKRVTGSHGTYRRSVREGDIGSPLGEKARANPDVAIWSYPFFDPQHGPSTNVVLHARDLGQCKGRGI